ncbi:hypothetical protein DIPPA_11728 [Diplonema papillatum]|nr:hypothetical protein DIPPA_11728 [Diplonema papillatum]
MGGLLSSLLDSWSKQKARVLMLGLDAAGKTTVLTRVACIGRVAEGALRGRRRVCPGLRKQAGSSACHIAVGLLYGTSQSTALVHQQEKVSTKASHG